MSAPEKLSRPPQTTLVGWVILIGSVYVALQSFDTLSSLRSMATRELIEDMLKAMGNPEGVTIEDGVTALRGVTVVAAVCAAASAVLAFFALRGDKGSRLGLSVLAVPLAVSAVATGGFITFMVVAGVALLWIQPSRNWFAGLPPVQPPAQPAQGLGGPRATGPDVPPRAPQAGDEARPYGQPYGSTASSGTANGAGSDQARPVDGFGARPTWEVPGVPAAAPEVDGARPREVKVAAWVAIVFSALGFVSTLLSVIYVAGASEGTMSDLFDQVMTDEQRASLSDQGLGVTELTETLTVMAVVIAVLCLFGILAAVMALNGNNTGRVLLVVISVGVLLFSLVGVLSSPILLVTLLAAGYVVRQLLRPNVVAWYRRAR